MPRKFQNGNSLIKRYNQKLKQIKRMDSNCNLPEKSLALDLSLAKAKSNFE